MLTIENEKRIKKMKDMNEIKFKINEIIYE